MSIFPNPAANRSFLSSIRITRNRSQQVLPQEDYYVLHADSLTLGNSAGSHGQYLEEESSRRLEPSCLLYESSRTKTFAISEMGDDELAQIRQRRMAEMQAMQVGQSGHELNNTQQFCRAGPLDVKYAK